MRFPQEFIEKVTDSNNLVDLISQYSQLKRSGSQLMGRCPFPDHAEKTPSFSVSESKQVYHCFGCGKSGNIFTFLRDYQGMSFPEAVEFLADRAGLAMPAPVSVESLNAEEKLKLKKRQIAEANKWALQYYRAQLKNLPKDHAVREYIRKRGLSAETLETFQIGYAGSEWDGLLNFLKSKGLAAPIAEEAQLVKAKQGGQGHFDLFRERIIFPILNHLGDPIAFGGRIVFDGQPKYLNSPETPLFSKSRTLYGLHHTAKYIRSEDLAVVVEGYMDAVSLYQAGVKNVVAIMGTAFTSDHGRLLKRMTPHVLVMLDGDAAGQNAAERALPTLLAQGLYPRGLVLPGGQDPDDFVKTHGVSDLKLNIEKAQDLFKIVATTWLENYRGESQQKVQIADRAKPIFDQISDSRLKKLYTQELAQLMQVSPQWLFESMGGSQKSVQRRPVDQSLKTNRVENVSSEASPVPAESVVAFEIYLKDVNTVEQTVLSLAIKSRANFKVFTESNVTQFINHAGVKSVLDLAANLSGQDPEKFDRLLSLLVAKVDVPEMLFFQDRSQKLRLFSGASTQAQTNIDEDDSAIEQVEADKELQILKDAIRRAKELGLKDQLKKIAIEMKEQPKADTVQRMMQLQTELKQLAIDSVKTIKGEV
ncbi:MAG: DNA primase [Bdellovibrionales bacterium]